MLANDLVMVVDRSIYTLSGMKLPDCQPLPNTSNDEMLKLIIFYFNYLKFAIL